MADEVVPLDKLPPSAQASADEVVPDNKLAPEQQDEVVPASKLLEGSAPNEEKYGTPGQQALTAVEGAAQGAVGFVAPLVEKGLSNLGIPGLTEEDIKGRAETNPLTHGTTVTGGFIGSNFIPGVGQAKLINSVAHAVPEALMLGKVASGVLKGAIQGGLFQVSDELTKSLTGQSDPNHAIASGLANTGASMLLGSAFGGSASALSGVASKRLEQLAESKLVSKGNQFLQDFGEHWQQLTGGGEPEKATTLGGKLAALVHKNGPKAIADAAITGTGEVVGGPAGAAIANTLGHYTVRPLLEKFVGRPLTEKAVPIVLNALGNGEVGGLTSALEYAANAARGSSKMTRGVDAVFKEGLQKAYDATVSEGVRDKIKNYIEKGGVNAELRESASQTAQEPQGEAQSSPLGFAEGGDVPPSPEALNAPTAPAAPLDPVATHFPNQATPLGIAKGRVSNYLSQLRPQPNQAKLAFDNEPPSHDQKKAYDKVVALAANPLSILNHLKDGSLTPETMKHFTALYPEIHQDLSKRLTEKIVKAQLKGEKIPFARRQAISMFLGAPLDSALTPANVRAAQATFQNQASQAAPNTPVTKNKKNTAKLDKFSNQFETIENARQARQQKLSASITGK